MGETRLCSKKSAAACRVGGGVERRNEATIYSSKRKDYEDAKIFGGEVKERKDSSRSGGGHTRKEEVLSSQEKKGKVTRRQ